jgi:hypothetical protein
MHYRELIDCQKDIPMATRKLERNEVIAARNRAALGVPIARLAREHLMSTQAMRNVIYGITYTDIPGALPQPKGKPHPGRKLKPSQVRTMRRERKAKETLRTLSKRYHLSTRSVVLACDGTHYSEIE